MPSTLPIPIPIPPTSNPAATRHVTSPHPHNGTMRSLSTTQALLVALLTVAISATIDAARVPQRDAAASVMQDDALSSRQVCYPEGVVPCVSDFICIYDRYMPPGCHCCVDGSCQACD